jgi:hypothetical protein
MHSSKENRRGKEKASLNGTVQYVEFPVHTGHGMQLLTKPVHKTFAYNCSQILSPWLGDILDSGIGLSYRPATSLCSMEDRYDKPYARVDYIPQPGTKNLASVED